MLPSPHSLRPRKRVKSPRVDPGSLPPQANALEYLPWTRPTMSNRDMDHFFTIFTVSCKQGNGPPLGVAAHDLSPVLYALSCGCAYGPVLLLRASSRPASGKRSDA